jgi:glycosyltransferase involved in cell wall biosynthesis
MTGKTAPLLSILIPVYNVEPFLSECIDSIFTQKIDDTIEVIMVEDCSTDGSYRIANMKCAEQRHHLRLIPHAKNSGLSAARNTLLNAATGEYVWFLDSDDKLLPGSLAKLRAILTSHAPDIVICDYGKDDGPKVSSFDGTAHSLQDDTEELIRGVFSARKMHSWSKVWRRSLWHTDIRFPEGRIFEDIATTPWVLLRARSFYYAPDKWIFYRQRHDSIMGLVSRGKGFDEQGQDNLASALSGFKEQLRQDLENVAPETEFAIAHFIARCFTAIGFKLVREKLFRQRWSEIRRLMQVYLAQTEAASPITFAQLTTEYRKKRIYLRRIVLQIFCWIAGPRPHPVVAHSLKSVERVAPIASNGANIPNLPVEPRVKKR